MSCTAVTREAMIATASSTDIIGPPKAKQSSLSCAMASASRRIAREHVLDAHRGSVHQCSDGRDVIEMNGWKPGFGLGIARNAHDPRIVGKQRRLAVGDAIYLDL